MAINLTCHCVKTKSSISENYKKKISSDLITKVCFFSEYIFLLIYSHNMHSRMRNHLDTGEILCTKN